MTDTNFYWQDDLQISVIDANLAKVKTTLQTSVDAFAGIGIKIQSIGEIQSVLEPGSRKTDPVKLKRFIMERTYSDIPANMDREMFLQVAKVPDMTGIIEALKPLNEFIRGGGIRFPDVVYWNAYTLAKGRVETIPDAIDAIKAPFRKAASSPEEGQRLALCRELCELMETAAALRPDLNPDIFAIPGMIERKSDGKFQPRPEYVSTPVKFNIEAL